uniref:Uncharacterized protein n=1 Tax=Anguilla anguilla TaxID=7936 RepID=A0A0E9WBY4_ANGAN
MPVTAMRAALPRLCINDPTLPMCILLRKQWSVPSVGFYYSFVGVFPASGYKLNMNFICATLIARLAAPISPIM